MAAVAGAHSADRARQQIHDSCGRDRPADRGVATVTEVGSVQTGAVTCTCAKPIGDNFALLEVPPASLGRVTKLVAGRLPRQSATDEVLASFTLTPLGEARVAEPAPGLALDPLILSLGRRVTNWTWPQLQVVVSRRLLLHARKVVQVMPDGDLQDVRGGP